MSRFSESHQRMAQREAALPVLRKLIVTIRIFGSARCVVADGVIHIVPPPKGKPERDKTMDGLISDYVDMFARQHPSMTGLEIVKVFDSIFWILRFLNRRTEGAK